MGLKFIINTILTSKGDVAGLVAGDLRRAFQRGTELSKAIYGVPFHQTPEIVIANSFPYDLDLWQVYKSLYQAVRIVSKGKEAKISVLPHAPDALPLKGRK